MHAAVTPRPAATTLIVRQGAAGLEVLMVRRSMQASFMPGAYVFPGGAVDEADGSAEHGACCDEHPAVLTQRLGQVVQVGDQALAYAVGALRECFEECGLWLGAGSACEPADGWAGLRARLHGGDLMAMRLSEGKRMPSDRRFRNVTIDEIARRCGSPDASHFARQFRRRHGVAPAAFRAVDATGLPASTTATVE